MFVFVDTQAHTPGLQRVCSAHKRRELRFVPVFAFTVWVVESTQDHCVDDSRVLKAIHFTQGRKVEPDAIVCDQTVSLR